MTRDMKPERIEELARLAYEAALLRNRPWSLLTADKRSPWLRIARALYAEIMSKDAAGVAETVRQSWRTKVKEMESEYLELARERYGVTSAMEIAAALEAKAQEARDADHG
jgi:hypothetical protein